MSYLENYEATAAGEQLLHDPNATDLLSVVDAFYGATDQAPEAVVFRSVTDMGGNYVAGGRFSHVMRLGAYAIKVSTLTSTASEEHPDVEPFAENAVAQLHFLDSLRTHLDTQPEAGITTPEQYFALRGEHGGYLAVQQFMDGWISFGRWVDKAPAIRFGEDDEADAALHELSNTVRDRIELAVAGTDLRQGLNDLRLDGELVHPGNILVPRSARHDPVTVPLCIIDQPKGYTKQSSTD